MGEHKLKKDPTYRGPITDDEVANQIWNWCRDNAFARSKNEYPNHGWDEGTLGFSRNLAAHLREKGLVK